MHFLYSVLRFFPFWVLPTAFILAEIGLFFRRRKSRLQFTFFGLAGFLFLLTLLWFGFRGDLYSDQWLNALF